MEELMEVAHSTVPVVGHVLLSALPVLEHVLLSI